MKTAARENLNGTLNRKTATSSSTQPTNNNVNQPVNVGNNTSAIFDHKTFVKVFHGDNKIVLLNSLCSCLHMLNHLKEQLNLNKDELIDLMDFDGNLKEIPNLNNKDYAIQFLAPAGSYAVLRIELDANTNEKRYNPLLNDNRLTANMIKTLTNLNTGKNLTAKDKAKLTREARLKAQQTQQQQSQPQQMQNLSQGSASNLASLSNSSGNIQPNSSSTQNQPSGSVRKVSRQFKN